MKEPFRLSKIRPHRLSRILHRGRLFETFEQHREKKIILVLGQAAQGKSTLAASFVERDQRRSAWINLSQEESDPLNLYSLLSQSVQYALSDSDLSDIFQYAAMDLGPRAEVPLYQGWIHALTGRITSPILIILDGLDRLSPEAPSFRLMQVLLEEAGSNMRFILLSRIEPPFEMQRLRMRQEAAVIDNAQLAFTLEETGKYFSEIHNLSLSAEQLIKIQRLTEGWVGGLLLFSEALKRSPKKVQQHFLLEEFIAEYKKEAFRYLGDEIFSSLGDNVKDFLVKSSIFDVIDPVSVKELLETEDAEAVLKELSDKNLFVQSLYDQERGWLFRYHQMFKDFLRIRFDSETTRKEKQRLFIKAGNFFEQSRDYGNALNFYFEAQAFQQASTVLEQFGMDLLKSGRVGNLSQWLRMLPDDLIQQNPWLLYYLCMTRRFTATRENAHALLNCQRLFEEQEDARGLILALAFLIEAYALGGYYPVPIEGLVARAEKLIENIPQDLYTYESAFLWFQIGQGWTLACGNPRKGFWCCQKAYLIAGDYGDINLQISAMTRAVHALSWLGEFASADELCREVRKLVEASPYPELQAYHRITSAGLSMLKGEIRKAGEQILLAYTFVEKHGLLYWYPPTLATDLLISVFSGELEKAANIASHLLNLASSMGNRVFEGIALLDTAWICYCKSEWPKAKKLVEQAAQILSSDKSLYLIHYHVSIVVRSLILYHLEDDGEADKALQETIDHLSRVALYLFLIDAHLAMVLSNRKQGKNDKAAFHLKEGFRLAEEKKHFHCVLLSREDFADACVLALNLNVEESVAYASHLLATHLSDLADLRLKRLAVHSNAKVRLHVHGLRKTIHRAALPHLRIKCLGNFQIWRGEELIEDKQWQRVQPKNLLKVLLTQGAWHAAREVIMEDLWPEGEPQANEKNFKVTLHRLRKVLEPGMDKSFGSSYLHLVDNRLTLDQDLCSVDIEDFLTFSGYGQEEEKKENIKKAIFWYGKATDLYTGDFLAEDLYLACAESKRQAFKKKQIEVLFRMAALYEKQGKAKRAIQCCQRIIGLEPVLEEAYQKMMCLYGNCGMQNAAIRIYKAYQKMLTAEFSCEPDEATQAIYRRIAHDT